MTVGKDRSLDPGNNLPWREVSGADREWYLACSSSIKSLACLIARGRVSPKIIGSRLSICAFHPRRGDPKIVIILPLYSRFQVMELTSACCSEIFSWPTAASIFDGVLIFLSIPHNRPVIGAVCRNRDRLRTSPIRSASRSNIGTVNPAYGTLATLFPSVHRCAPRRNTLQSRGTSIA